MPSLGLGVLLACFAAFLALGLALVLVADRVTHRGTHRRPDPRGLTPDAEGWYADPYGSHARRWFDGSAWTDRIK